MRLFRLGDEGPPIGDIQDRLAALGFESAGDTRGVFGDFTLDAVVAFQKAKGLDGDGIVGPDTWRSLYEAGYRLGDRLVFMRRPMLRGEDVAELQSRLNSLGFDSGKADGIFGPDTETAVIDFQHNRNLAEDGKAGPEVVTEIHLVSRGDIKEGRHALREREWLRRLPPTVAGTRVYLDAGCRDPHETRQAWEAASGAARISSSPSESTRRTKTVSFTSPPSTAPPQQASSWQSRFPQLWADVSKAERAQCSRKRGLQPPSSPIAVSTRSLVWPWWRAWPSSSRRPPLGNDAIDALELLE